MFRTGVRFARVAAVPVLGALLATQLGYGADPDPVALRQAQVQSWQQAVFSARLAAARELAVARQSVVGQQVFAVPAPPVEKQVEKLTTQQERMLSFVIAMMRLHSDPRLVISKVRLREQLALNLGMKWVREVDVARVAFRNQELRSLVAAGMARGHQASGAYGRVVSRRAQQRLRAQIGQMREASTLTIRQVLVPRMRMFGDPAHTLAYQLQMVRIGRWPGAVRPPMAPTVRMPSAVAKPPMAPPLTNVQQQMRLQRP